MMPVVDQLNLSLLILAVVTLSFINGYRFALSKAGRKKNYTQKDKSYNYDVVFKQEQQYNLTFLFYSILSLDLYATTITKFVRDNLDEFTSILEMYTNSRLVWVFLLVLISTILIFLLGWFFPRMISGLAPRRFAQFFFPLVRLMHNIVYPVAQYLYNFSKNFVKIMFNEKQGFNKYILVHSQLSASELRAVLDPNEQKNKVMLDNAYDFQFTKTKHITVPRNEVKYVDIKDPISVVQKEFVQTKLSKLIVIENSIDKVQGYVHYLDLFENPKDVASITQNISVIPEGMPLPQLLDKLKEEKQSIAWVIDEFGGTSGIVTMEDVTEEIFGNIKDEHDMDIEYLDKKVKKGEYLFSGRLELSYLEDKYGLEFPDAKDVETLSGYVIQHMNEIPKNGDKINIENTQYNILSVKDKKIESLQVKVTQE